MTAPAEATTIAHVTTVHPRGDTRIAVKEAATLQRALGGVALFVQDGGGNGTGPGGVRVVDTGPRPASRLLRMTGGAWRMTRAVAAARPRIAHFHDPELIPAALWWKIRGIKVVYDVHEDLPRQVLTKPWIPRLLRRPVAGLVTLAEGLAGRLMDGIVAATAKIGARFSPARTAVVQNFPDLRELSFAALMPHAARPPHVLYVGGITEIRGIETMVRAMALVRTPGARLRLAGSFASPALEARMAALDGWDRVDPLGWAERREVHRLLSEVRAGLVLLAPAPNYVEAQPVKMFEYMAAGLPVIASDFPRWRALVGDADCALFVDPGDPAAAAAAIDGILADSARGEAMGARGCAAVRTRFNWANEAETLLELYRRLDDETALVRTQQGKP